MSGEANPDCTLDGPPPYNCQGCDLSGRDLAGKDLTSAQLQGATLTGTSFKGVVSLKGADLTGAVMGNGTDFSGCDLSATVFGANPKFGSNAAKPTIFAGATIPYATLGNRWSYLDLRRATITGLPQALGALTVTQCNLGDFDFSGHTLENAHFYDSALQGADFHGCHMARAVFTRRQSVCDLSRAKFPGADLTDAVFGTSTLTSVNFTAATLTRASFLNTRMDGTRFDGCDVTTCAFSTSPRFSSDPANLTSFRGATLNFTTVRKQWSYLDLTGATLVGLDAGVDLSYLQATCAVLTGMDLSGYQLDDCNLSGATLTGVRFSRASMVRAVLFGVQNACELFRVPMSSAEYNGFLTALKQKNVAGVVAVLGNHGEKLDPKTASLSVDNPNRWWTVTGAGGDVSYAVATADATKGPLIVFASRMATRFDGAHLPHANLSPYGRQVSVLRGADFSGATLDDADLSSADLSQINPYQAKTASTFKAASMNRVGLSHADLTGAVLTGTVYLHGADMVGTTLKNADLTGAQLGKLAEAFRVPQSSDDPAKSADYVKLLAALASKDVATVATVFAAHDCAIVPGRTTIAAVVDQRSWTVTDSSTQTSYTVLNWTSGDGQTFLIVSSPTAAAALTSAYMPGAKLVDANLYGVAADYVHLYGNAKLDGAILDEVTLTNANLGASSMIVKALYGVNLSGANLVNATLKGADLTQGVKLSRANLLGTDLTNTKLAGANLADAAVAVPLTDTTAGVFLFGVASGSAAPVVADLSAATKQVNLTPDGDQATIDHYVAYLNSRTLDDPKSRPPGDLRAAFKACGVTFSAKATIQPADDAWQILDPSPPGNYTVWVGYDDLGFPGLFARPDVPALRAAFKRYSAVAGTLRWQATVTAEPSGNQWRVDNDSNNPDNLQLGYATLFVGTDPDGSLAFYGTTLRIQQMGDRNQAQITTLTYHPTVLCPVDAAGKQNCKSDGSSSFFGPSTTCPNGRTLCENQGSRPKVTWAYMLRASEPPVPPSCVPGPYADCPQASSGRLGAVRLPDPVRRP